MADVALSGANIQKTVLEAAFDALGLAILVCDKSDAIIYASRPILQFYPIPARFLEPGTRLKDYLGAIFDSGARSGTAPESSRRHASRDEWISENLSHHWRERFEVVERIGRHRWISVRKRRLPNGLGIVSITDVSDQKKREEQIQVDLERVELTESILDSLKNPVCVKDRNLNYIAVNKAFCEVHGVTADAILGRSVWDVLDAELAERCERSDRATLETGSPHSAPEQIVKADGEDLWVVTQKFRIGDPGKYVLVTCMSDVTDLVVGFPQKSADGTEVSPFAVRDYNNFEPAQNCYDPFRSIDMQHLVEASAIIDAPAADRQRVLVLTGTPALEQSLVPQLRRWGFDACAVRSEQELFTFAEVCEANAFPVHALLVDAGFTGSDALISTWSLSASMLLQADSRAAGLRDDILALCTATLTLPAVKHADWDIVLPEPTAVGFRPEIEVVVAEDNEINQFVFAQILEGLGLSYRIAVNGEEAVRLWQTHRPNLVLMDVSLPVMNGFDAARAIRSIEKGATRTPIVSVITQALDIDIAQTWAAGMDDYIVKPISPDMVEAVYRKLVEENSRQKAI